MNDKTNKFQEISQKIKDQDFSWGYYISQMTQEEKQVITMTIKEALDIAALQLAALPRGDVMTPEQVCIEAGEMLREFINGEKSRDQAKADFAARIIARDTVLLANAQAEIQRLRSLLKSYDRQQESRELEHFQKRMLMKETGND